jgi:hypothetical protein
VNFNFDSTLTCAPALTRRAFVGATAITALGLAFAPTSFGAVPGDCRWIVIREIVQSQAIGAVCIASALVPLDAMDLARKRYCDRYGEKVPAPIAHALDGIVFALSRGWPARVRTAEHCEAGTFSMTCWLDGGGRIAIAGAPAGGPLCATLRGGTGALYMTGNTLSVESSGHWREVRT